MAADTARQFTMSIGIMQAQDAEIQSPNIIAEKGKAKDVDEQVSSVSLSFQNVCDKSLIIFVTRSLQIVEKSPRHDQEACSGEKRKRKETAGSE